MKKSSKLAAQITEYGTPPDLSEHMPLFETAPDQDEIIDAWNKRRSHRKVSIEELDEIEFAHERINSIMSQNSIRSVFIMRLFWGKVMHLLMCVMHLTSMPYI